MVSAVFMFLGCCAASVTASQAWWWQLPMLDRLRQGQPLTPWEDPTEIPAVAVLDDANKLKLLLMGLPKRGPNHQNNAKDDRMNRMIQNRIDKFRKLTEGGRPRGHPLRWG